MKRENLNSDDQQFHRYQHNQQPPLASNHRTQNRPQRTAWKIKVIAWDRNTNVAGSNQLMLTSILTIESSMTNK